MKTLKQIIEEVQQYQCTEGSKADCELRSSAIRVNVLREMYDIFVASFNNIDEATILYKTTDDFATLANLVEPFVAAITERLRTNMDPYTVFEIKRTLKISGNREELLAKYDGKDKEFVEQIIRETEEYFDVTYRKK